MKATPMTDEALIQGYYECDGEAFDELCLRYDVPLRIRITGILKIYGIIRRPDIVEDLFQTTLFKVLGTKDRVRSRFDPKHQVKFSTWLYKIAANVVLDFLRKLKPEKSFTELEREFEEGESHHEDWPTSEIGEIEVTLNAKIDLERCLNRLDEEERACIFLFRDGKKLKEIAEALQLNMARADRLKWQALTKLHKCLSEHIS